MLRRCAATMTGMASAKVPAGTIVTNELRRLVDELRDEKDPAIRLQLATLAAQVEIGYQLRDVVAELAAIRLALPSS